MDFVDWLVNFSNWTWSWYDHEKNQNKSNAIAAALAGLIAVVAPLVAVVMWFCKKLFWSRDDHLQKQPSTQSDTHGPPSAMVTMTLEEYERRLEERARLAASTDSGADVARAQLDEVNRRLVNIKASYEAEQTSIVELEKLLDRDGIVVAAERMEAARKTLEHGDYSEADAVFAEIKEYDSSAVKRSARASYGRGEIARAEVRWMDALEHYSEAARLDPTYKHLRASGMFQRLTGKYDQAVATNTSLVELSRREFGSAAEQTAIALSNLSESLRIIGQFDEALPYIEQAIEITRTLPEGSEPDLYIQLGNLGLILMGLRRVYDALQPLKEAMSESVKARGTKHPDTARTIHNLAGCYLQLGKFDKAEPLAREAIEISRAALA